MVSTVAGVEHGGVLVAIAAAVASGGEQGSLVPKPETDSTFERHKQAT